MINRISLLFFLLGLTCKISCQNFNNSIIEVYSGKDTIETFDYRFKIVSKGDTIEPIIENKYFLPTLQLDTFVTVIIYHNDKRIMISHVENIFLLGHSLIKAKFSPPAIDSCLKAYFIFADMTNIAITGCEQFNEISFEKFNVYNSDAFFKKWKKKHKDP